MAGNERVGWKKWPRVVVVVIITDTAGDNERTRALCRCIRDRSENRSRTTVVRAERKNGRFECLPAKRTRFVSRDCVTRARARARRV